MRSFSLPSVIPVYVRRWMPLLFTKTVALYTTDFSSHLFFTMHPMLHTPSRLQLLVLSALLSDLVSTELILFVFVPFMMASKLGRQEYEIFKVFLLNNLWSSDSFGKCLFNM